MKRPNIYEDVIKLFPNKTSYEQRDMHIRNQDKYIDYLEANKSKTLVSFANEFNSLLSDDQQFGDIQFIVDDFELKLRQNDKSN